jgi:hypothetical protein
MSAPAATADRSPAAQQLTEKQRRILAFLRDRADGTTYFKSRLVGEELDLSAKEVGTNMPALADADVGLRIERWGYSSATTWKVTP